jgi:hypothetical protein
LVSNFTVRLKSAGELFQTISGTNRPRSNEWRRVWSVGRSERRGRPGGYQLSNFGGALSISGSTAVVGAFLAGSNRAGKSYVYVEPQNGWTDATEPADLNPPTGAQSFGSSVSVTGNTVVVGAPSAFQNGSAFVYRKPKTGWVNTRQFNAPLRASDGAYRDLFGASVGVSGQTIVIGAIQHNDLRGAGYIFAH